MSAPRSPAPGPNLPDHVTQRHTAPHVSGWSRFGASRASGHITRLRVSSRQHAVSNSSAVVDQILNMIKDTDGGMSLSDDKKGEVDLLLDQLEEAGSGSAPLIDPRLMGNYELEEAGSGSAPLIDQGSWATMRWLTPAPGMHPRRLATEAFESGTL
eukprot:gene1373-32738_t